MPAGKGGVISGVSAGLAVHLGLPLWLVRLVLVLLAPTGISILLYAWLWIFMPRGNPWVGTSPAFTPNSRLANANKTISAPHDAIPRWSHLQIPAISLAICLIFAAIFGAIKGPGLLNDYRLYIAAILVLAGIALIWAGASRQSPLSGLQIGQFLAFAIPGGVLVIFAVIYGMSGSISFPDALRGGFVTLVVLALLSLAVLPLWMRFWNSYKESLSEQARQTVRADMAAHLHDSVLQTLALIRNRCEDSAEVAKLARSEERRLRSWLYEDRSSGEASLAQVMKDLSGEIEDRYGVVVDTVTVGDSTPGTWSEPLVAATREALTNATKHGAPPYSLYLEVSTDKAECFVRDHGEGLDLAAIPEGHQGVKHSIIERLERHGGTVKIRCTASGTEIAMQIPKK